MTLSYNISIFYLVTAALSIPIVIYVTNRPTHILKSEIFKRNWGILYEEYRLDYSTSRFFKAFSILRFLVFGMVLVFFYYIPLIQITGSFFVAIAYLVLVIIKRPHASKSDFFIEFIRELLFTLANFFFFVLALDESYNIVTVDTRVQIGWFIVVIFVIALIVSIMLVLNPAIKCLTSICQRKKKNKDEEEDDSEEANEVQINKNKKMRPQSQKELELQQSKVQDELETSKMNTSLRNIKKDKD